MVVSGGEAGHNGRAKVNYMPPTPLFYTELRIYMYNVGLETFAVENFRMT